MVNAFVLATGNTTILERALPILDAELDWWRTNRTISVTSPFTNKTHSVAHFAVNNTAPRPEVCRLPLPSRGVTDLLGRDTSRTTRPPLEPALPLTNPNAKTSGRNSPRVLNQDGTTRGVGRARLVSTRRIRMETCES